MKYSPEIHINKLTLIIERMANNHFKWYLSLISLTPITIAISNIDTIGDSVIVKLAVLAPICLVILVVALNSHYYLKMERSFRNLERKVMNGKITSWEFNWKNHYVKTIKVVDWLTFILMIVNIAISVIIIFIK